MLAISTMAITASESSRDRRCLMWRIDVLKVSTQTPLTSVQNGGSGRGSGSQKWPNSSIFEARSEIESRSGDRNEILNYLPVGRGGDEEMERVQTIEVEQFEDTSKDESGQDSHSIRPQTLIFREKYCSLSQSAWDTLHSH